MRIENGDEYQGFEVKKASESEIVLKNSKSITLNLDKDAKNYFTDSWYFQTSDEGKGSTSAEGYVIYPAKELNASGNYTLRGIPYDTNETLSDGFIWNATTFGGFNYPVNKHKDFVAPKNWWGERLQYVEEDGENELGKNNPGNHVIGEDELVYTTRPFSNKYELVSDLELNAKTTPEELGGMFYYKLAWFGKQYVTVGNDSTQLANLVFDQKSDKKQLKAGDSWDLGKNYSLEVNQVDVEGEKVWFTLYEKGEELESGIVNTNGTIADKTFTATADFGDKKDQLYFVTYVDTVFTSATDSFAVFKYTWLIDKDNVMLIENGDEYQGFEVKKASENEIVLKNSKSITLNIDKDVKNYFTDSWYFQTSDEGKGSTSTEGYVIYPATDVIIEDNATSGPAGNMTSTKEANATEEKGNLTEKVTETTVNNTDSKIASNEPASSAPLIQNKAEDLKSSDIPEEEAGGEEASSKAPGFEVLGGVFGIALSQALLKRRD